MNVEVIASRMDLLGLLAFLYIIIYSLLALKEKKRILNWILLIIGIMGFLFDFFIVVNTYLLN